MKQFQYPALRMRQTEKGRWLVLFGASACEIGLWGGVPQKRRISDGETTGFQREVKDQRLKDLVAFYKDHNNTIQNPLLCAARELGEDGVFFMPSPTGGSEEGAFQVGVLHVSRPDYEDMSLLELLTKTRLGLEKRVPELAQQPLDQERVRRIRESLAQVHTDLVDQLTQEEDEDYVGDAKEEVDLPSSDVAAAFLEETHISDFWQEVAARELVLKELKGELEATEIDGYSRDVLITYLKPVIVVDGQHRLAGAIAAAKAIVESGELKSELESRVLDGESFDAVQKELEDRAARNLPVSLLMSDDPSEHVFQFVVVNQKATPIGKALLGTIVSTTLSADELERVSERLLHSGIALDTSRAVAVLTRSPMSPFYGLVETGVESEQGKLPWSVMSSLVNIFRYLENGRLYHENPDYAAGWRDKVLNSSAIVADWEEEGCSRPLEYWSSDDGPWRDVFVKFWICVRDKFGDVDDPGANNYWGNTRSNLFNKPSLTILAADFFQYLATARRKLDSVDDVGIAFEEWLDGVSSQYFAKAWPLRDVKKDSPGTRKNWSKIWTEYRKVPQKLPRVDKYAQSRPD